MRLLTLLLMLLALGVAGCGDDDDDGGDGSTESTETQTQTTAEEPQKVGGCLEVTQPEPRRDGGEQKPSAPLSGDYEVTFETNCGSFTVEMDEDVGGLSAASFAQLAQSGFYEDTFFHRIAPGFVIQGGDPTGTGTGGPGYTTKDPPPSDTAAEHLGLQGRGADEGRVQDDRSQIREEAFPQAEEGHGLRALLRRQGSIAGRVADGAEVDGVAGAAELDGLRR
jgi:cyclophilin family peptidyl-prolyl cis-trans isomerase